MKKITTIAMSFSLIGGMIFAAPGVVYAADTNTAKEENVYATLNENGSVQGIYVVNAYDLSADTNIVDYGSYTSLKNLTNENTIDENGDEISVDASKGKFYYQGDLDAKDLPWNIQIHYYLDGKEVNGEELAGKSGSLKIEIELTQNENVDASFFENYLLQATIALPADQCTNIVADGATVANMSGDKQILFNVMGGQEKTLTVASDVTDFEMSAISFKGVPMSFDINLDDIDTSELTDKTEELTDGVTQLNEGAGQLQDGTSQLQDGLSTYTSGVNRLGTGANSLSQATSGLPAMMTTLSQSVSELENGSAQLADVNSGAAAQISEKLEDISDGLINVQTGLNGIRSYVTYLQSVQSEYQSEAEMLQGIIESSGTSAVNGSQAERESNTVNGEYTEDYTDSFTKESVDEEGNKVITVTNNIYRTRENTTTITNQITTQSSGNVDITKLQTLYARISRNAQALDGVLYGDGTEMNPGLVAALAQCQNGVDLLLTGTTQLKDAVSGDSEISLQSRLGVLNSGMAALNASTQKLPSAGTQIVSGITQLESGTNALASNNDTLLSGASSLSEGMSTLKDGTQELSDQTSDMDAQIMDALGDKLNNFTGQDYDGISFVSEENTNVEAVQFAIQTQDIKIAEAEEEEAAEETSNFLDKFKALFAK